MSNKLSAAVNTTTAVYIYLLFFFYLQLSRLLPDLIVCRRRFQFIYFIYRTIKNRLLVYLSRSRSVSPSRSIRLSHSLSSFYAFIQPEPSPLEKKEKILHPRRIIPAYFYILILKTSQGRANRYQTMHSLSMTL